MKIVAITPDRKRDYLAETIIEGLRDLGVELHVSDPGNGVETACSEDEFVRHAEDADYVFVLFGKVRDNRVAKRHLLDRISARDKTVYVDGSEWTCTAQARPGQIQAAKHDYASRRGEPWLDEDMLKKCRWYFKHSCYPQDLERGVLPLQLGVVKHTIVPKAKERDIDLLCSFGQTLTGMRSEILELCRAMEREGRYKIVTSCDMTPDVYRNVLARSRVVVDVWGASENNARFWEVVGNGACCIHQRYTTVMLHPFEDMRQAVSYATLDEFKERVELLLADRALTDKIGDAAQEHAERYHTAKARVQHILDVIKK